MSPTSRACILCVDDEPSILEGLALHLRRFDVISAVGAAAALEKLQQAGAKTPAVVISDMQMPGMDGATFLSKVRQLYPDTVRLLLTGHAEMDAAMAAINQGGIFRFLTKPCPPPTLLAAVDAALEQHRLITAERVLLEQTLHGSIKTLVEVLSLSNPVAFGRADRLKQHVSDIAEKLNLRDRWHMEVAAMLSQLGYVTLPSEVAESVYSNLPLSPQEQAMVARLPIVTEQLLRNIPRLEIVCKILAQAPESFREDSPTDDSEMQIIRRGAQILRLAMDFDTLESMEGSAVAAMRVLRSRSDQYNPLMLNALDELRARGTGGVEILEIALSELEVGMSFADDVRMNSGVLFVGRGYVITESFLDRCRNFRRGAVKEPVRVIAPLSR